MSGVCFLIGGVAQLGERLLCKQEVIGSNPFTSTNRQSCPRKVRPALPPKRLAAQGRARGSEKIATPPQAIAAGLIEG